VDESVGVVLMALAVFGEPLIGGFAFAHGWGGVSR
jgi:hypothetical protein